MALRQLGRMFLLLAVFHVIGINQSFAQLQAYPPHWFQNTQNKDLEILLHNPSGFKELPIIKSKEKLAHVRVELAQNREYAYLIISLQGFTADDFTIEAGKEKLLYRLKAKSTHTPQRLSPADAMYLITPDRFANGKESNDLAPKMNESKYGRSKPFGRHGGDVAGITSKLEYLKETGFSALWISPLLENNEFIESYHGYAITNHYKLDQRFGSNAEFGELVDKMHESQMKMVMDMVYNHFGSQHHLFLNPPDSNFFHFQKDFVKTNYRAVTVMDPHASKKDFEVFANGWFDNHMPDVNQKNPHMQQFLIQNSLWWIFEYGVDAFRIDTYAYPDQDFIALLGARVKEEFPNFFLFGEIWVHMPEIQSYFVANNKHNPVNTHLDAVTDFQLKYAIKEALHTNQGWTSGIAKVYYRLAADYLYQNPENLVTFIDNHDEARIFGELNGDLKKLKVALGMLYTMRGIPCTYYGTEILMKETANHGVIRQPFPGGWLNDSANKFTAQGRTEKENEAYNFVKDLLNWRAQQEAITQGGFTHFIPEDDVYVYFRHSENQTIMVLVNTNEKNAKTVELARFAELWPTGSKGTEALSGESLSGSEVKLPAMALKIFTLEK